MMQSFNLSIFRFCNLFVLRNLRVGWALAPIRPLRRCPPGHPAAHTVKHTGPGLLIFTFHLIPFTTGTPLWIPRGLIAPPPPMKLSGRISTNEIVLPPSAGLATLQATPLFLRPSVDHPWVLATNGVEPRRALS